MNSPASSCLMTSFTVGSSLETGSEVKKLWITGIQFSDVLSFLAFQSVSPSACLDSVLLSVPISLLTGEKIILPP